MFSPSVVELLYNDNLTMLPYNLFSSFIKFHIYLILRFSRVTSIGKQRLIKCNNDNHVANKLS